MIIETKFSIGDRVETIDDNGTFYAGETGTVTQICITVRTPINAFDGPSSKSKNWIDYYVIFDGSMRAELADERDLVAEKRNPLKHYTALLNESNAEKEAYELDNIRRGFEMERAS